MAKSLRLNPATKSGIEGLLAQSYGCVNPLGSSFKTSASNLRGYPTWYLRGMLSANAFTRQRWNGAKSQETMDWAAWELARSMLDESIKNSAGVLLYVDKMKNLSGDPVTSLIPSFDTSYVSSFSLPSLYFCHFHAVMSGLSLGGLIIRMGRVVVRDASYPTRWTCVNESWQEDWNRKVPRMAHEKVFQQYDAIQRQQVKWLPRRSDVLKELKRLREAVTYHTERMGAWSDKDSLNDLRSAFPDHIEFQKGILEPLVDVIKNGKWNRSYNPKKRTDPLTLRFNEYVTLANAVL